ncbi:MAG: hypothetical protein GX624_04950 [Actinobacteria bacterium]|nr:hypothetical protein [Actinomycetota bacterium]
MMLEDGSSRDFAVVARGLPADELEALQQGYEYGELDLVVLPHHGRSRLN